MYLQVPLRLPSAVCARRANSGQAQVTHYDARTLAITRLRLTSKTTSSWAMASDIGPDMPRLQGILALIPADYVSQGRTQLSQVAAVCSRWREVGIATWHYIALLFFKQVDPLRELSSVIKDTWH